MWHEVAGYAIIRVIQQDPHDSDLPFFVERKAKTLQNAFRN
jgi:hypothetical protein